MFRPSGELIVKQRTRKGKGPVKVIKLQSASHTILLSHPDTSLDMVKGTTKKAKGQFAPTEAVGGKERQGELY